MVGIYKIVSPSGKVYIGQSWDILQRWIAYHKGYYKRQPKLRNSFEKHGVSNHSFSVLLIVRGNIGQTKLNKLEQNYLDEYRDAGFEMLNVREAGCSGKHSEETKRKMKGRLGKWMIGRRLSAASIKKRTEKQKGQKRSEQTRARLSESKTGTKNPQYGKRPWNYGIPFMPLDAEGIKRRAITLRATCAKRKLAQKEMNT